MKALKKKRKKKSGNRYFNIHIDEEASSAQLETPTVIHCNYGCK